MCKYISSARRIIPMLAFTMFSALLLLGCDSGSAITDSSDESPKSALEMRQGKTGNAMAAGWSTPQRVLNINTATTPEVEVFNGKLHIVYRGQSSNRIGYLTMTASHVFSSPVVLADMTSGQPALAVNGSGNRLYLAYRTTTKTVVPGYQTPDGYDVDVWTMGVKYIDNSGWWSTTSIVRNNGQLLWTWESPEIVKNTSGGIELFYNHPSNYDWEIATSVETGNTSGVTNAGFQGWEISAIGSAPYATVGRYDPPDDLYITDLHPSLGPSSDQINGVELASGPTIARDNYGKLHIAYRGNNNGVGYVDPNSSFKGSIGTETGATPAIAVFNNRIYIFFKNDNNNELFYTYKNL